MNFCRKKKQESILQFFTLVLQLILSKIFELKNLKRKKRVPKVIVFFSGAPLRGGHGEKNYKNLQHILPPKNFPKKK
jgi:hypothetical protein